MIKFFRKIRQQLLHENKFTRYLLYAIGEIVLVVIGILIALQLNNWNEQRKLANADLQICQQLLEDALADSVFFQSRLTYLKIFKSTVGYIYEEPESRTVDSTIVYIVGNGGLLRTNGLRYLSNVVSNNKNIETDLISRPIKNELRRYQLQYDYVAGAIQLSQCG